MQPGHPYAAKNAPESICRPRDITTDAAESGYTREGGDRGLSKNDRWDWGRNRFSGPFSPHMLLREGEVIILELFTKCNQSGLQPKLV